MDKYKREYKKLKIDNEAKQEKLNTKISNLGNELEITKTDLAYQQRLNKKQKDEIQLTQKEEDNLNDKLK